MVEIATRQPQHLPCYFVKAWHRMEQVYACTTHGMTCSNFAPLPVLLDEVHDLEGINSKDGIELGHG